jgi:lipopolysaccharide biosynthesis glycosyltransferase
MVCMGQARASELRDPGRASAAERMGTEAIHIMLSTNAQYLQHSAVCLASVLANNPSSSFDIVVVHCVGEALDQQRLRKSLSRFPNCALRFHDFAPPAGVTLPLPGTFYTIETWARLWVSDYFPEDVERVLYLDSDIVVLGGIAPLWRTDLHGALLGAVDIPGSQAGVARLGIPAEHGYFNAGVLIIDLAQWRRTNALGTVLDLLRTYPERILTVDQDALNACFHARRQRLDYRWNVIWPFFREPAPLPLPRTQLDAVRREARIIHFNGASKPWSYFCEHPRKAEYETYLAMTEWRDFVPPDRTVMNRIRKTASRILPGSVKNAVKRLLAARARPASGRIAARSRPR